MSSKLNRMLTLRLFYLTRLTDLRSPVSALAATEDEVGTLLTYPIAGETGRASRIQPCHKIGHHRYPIASTFVP